MWTSIKTAAIDFIAFDLRANVASRIDDDAGDDEVSDSDAAPASATEETLH